MAVIPVGSAINLNGATRTLDRTQLNTLKFTPGGGANAPAVPFSDLVTWQSSGDGWQSWLPQGTPPTGYEIPTYVPMLNSLTGNWEIEAYWNQDAISNLAIPIGTAGDVYSIDSDGAFTIQPRLLSPAEETALQGTIAVLNERGTPQPALSNIKWTSGYVLTKPASQKAPVLLGARVELPTMQTGLWPAIWLMSANGGWPPEIDILECVQQAGQDVQYTSSIHSTAAGNTTTVWKNQPTIDPGYHDFWVVIYPDYLTIFYDGEAVASFPTPSDFENVPWYLIVNLAIAGPNNGWPGPLDPSVKVLPPYKTCDVIAMTMPAEYGNGSAVGYVPPSGASPITFSGTPTPPPTPTFTVNPPADPASGVIGLSGTALSPWVNVAGYDAAGEKVAPDTTPKNGAWSTMFDTTFEPDGPFALSMRAFSVPAGGTGGTSTTVDVTVNISNTPTPTPVPPTPTPTPSTPLTTLSTNLVTEVATMSAAYTAWYAAAQTNFSGAAPLWTKAQADEATVAATAAEIQKVVGP